MTSGHLYAILARSGEEIIGVKIGWSTNIEKRIKTYASAGSKVELFHTIQVEDKSLDADLKKCLKEMGKQVEVIDQKSTSEVYGITRREAIKILDHIQETQTVDEEYIQYVTTSNWQYRFMTIHKFVKHFIPKLVPFARQREICKEHAQSIYEGMKQASEMQYFTSIPIVIMANKNRTYDIIDGLHRVEAFKLISPSDVDLLQERICVNQYDSICSEATKYEIFRLCNKIIPIAELDINDEYVNELYTDLKKELMKEYGQKIFTEVPHDLSYISLSKIQSDISKNNIKIYGKIYDDYILSKEKIIKQFHIINDKLLTYICYLLEIDDFSQISDSKISDENYINLFEYLKRFNNINPNDSNTKITYIKTILDNVNQICQSSGKTIIVHGQRKITRKCKICVLGLLSNVNILHCSESLTTELSNRGIIIAETTD